MIRKTNKLKSTRHRHLYRGRYHAQGFTIVELLIVIVVIAILAAIVTVAYNGIQRQALTSMMKDTLSNVAQAMEVQAVETGSYTTIPSNVQIAPGVGVALTVVADATSDFCINATTIKNDNLTFYLQKGDQPSEGLCEGELIESTIAGDYNTDASGGDEDEDSGPISAAVALASAEGNFRLETNESWSTVTLSWDAVPGATRYEVQNQQGIGWCYRVIATGSGCYDVMNYSDTSWNIPSSTLSVVWTAAGTKPSTMTAMNYRWRSITSAGASQWQTLTFTPKSANELTKIKNFNVTPEANWAAMHFTWASIEGKNNIPSPRIEIQTQDGTSGWCYRVSTNGGSCYTNTSTGGVSWNIPIGTSEISWVSAQVKPSSVDVTHSYRIRLASSIVSGMTSEWVTVTVTPPTATDMDKIASFTVTPANNWSAINLDWTVGDVSMLPSPRIEIQTQDGTSGWCYRVSTNGGSCYTNTSMGGVSWNIPVATTSLSWNSTSVRPSASGIVHQYRIRVASSSIPGVASAWETKTLTPPTTDQILPIQNFVVTPSADWSSVTLSWNTYNSSTIAAPSFEIQTQSSGSGWCYHVIVSGGSCYTNMSYSDVSWNVPANSTGMTWTSTTARPTASGQTHEYRIRIRSNAIPVGVYGPWATYSLTRP